LPWPRTTQPPEPLKRSPKHWTKAGDEIRRLDDP
jgi:hypothetical protein